MSPSRSGPFEFTVMVDSFRVGSGRHRFKVQPCRPDLSHATRAGRQRLLIARLCYLVTVVTIQRVQTGFRIERTTLKVLKGLAEYLDVSLGNLVEGIVLHAFEGKAPFGQPTLTKIDQLRAVYGLTLTAAGAHQLKEQQ